ncbi:double-strand break repair helicase AddA [Sphingomonas cavernae]|uniref:DNA 3'-5' helicase n=1 Tax=Sphingomonas cavernae TaxID=2320861 RepID=A0A418WM34_9SPHN|nr:double-strand break repair helicase AddA [Sphingomonas cavernae]RJF91058.1 double-strand break repair helicase AddA [Sphingomonas cavernae]
MTSQHRPIQLQGNQKAASEPRESVWLSASAGTGKTQVLTARVLRLLLNGADPAAILCLTFTKAGAAEMADRIHAKLASWVRMKGPELALELRALGESATPESIDAARQLFARVLDASGAGLRIQTIHSFCQTLLAGFPLEAGLVPGFRALEGREESTLQRQVMADMLVAAEANTDDRLVAALQALSLRLGEGGAEAFLTNCARAPQAMEALGDDIAAIVRRALDVPEGDVESAVVDACCDDVFDIESLRLIAAANATWGSKTGLDRADIIAAWRAAGAVVRAEMLPDLLSVVVTQKGELKAVSPKLLDAEPGYAGYAQRVADCVQALVGLRSRAALAALFAQGLEAGRTYARAYAEAKRLAGVVDFDDLIRSAVTLLGQSHMAEWIRFKLDQATDHILVDEAQDTNASQWAIIKTLAEDFFAEELLLDDRERARTPVRTIFSVGDFKQAIFGFQGTDPINFRAAQLHFERQAAAAERRVHDLSLTESFRSTAPILEFVDTVVAGLGDGALSQMIDPEPHRSAVAGPGVVTLWSPVSAEGDDGDEIEGEESWLGDSTRRFATRLAKQIRRWLDAPTWINNRGRPKRLEPQDILILVRRRSELASLIVARLHAEKVPVAGVDRLRLNAPLAVRDLLAAIRFVLQPEDDLNLAALLVSPLLGWSQTELYAAAFGRKGGLWRHLRATQDVERLSPLHAMLGRADLSSPYRFLEELLSGPLDGRRKLLRRLGEEARDPIEELLNAALQFEGDKTPTLQAFLDRFERETEDIKRDPSAPMDAVRVMTAHGAKGLQAPLVILADATVDPERAGGGYSKLDWPIGEEGELVPVFRPRAAETVGSLKQAAEFSKKRDMEEHWRLLYVALTRAEEWLVVGGALGPQAKGQAPDKSWHAAMRTAFQHLEIDGEGDPDWGGAWHFRGRAPTASIEDRAQEHTRPGDLVALPDWIHATAPAEARPPRPLAPSSLGPDDVADPPPGPEMRRAAERGRRLHALFERLPDVRAAERRDSAQRWLEQGAGITDPAERSAITDAALAIIDDPEHAALFGPDALAEAPIAAVVDGDVVAGTVDRLLVGERVVRVVDFKTGRRVPASAERVPEHHLRQMSAYAEALKVIFPDRRVEAQLLYTSGPTLIDLSDALLARHKPGLNAKE